MRRLAEDSTREKNMRDKKICGGLPAIFLGLSLVLASGAFAQVGKSELVNPDLASEKELLALPHMNARLVKSVIEQRPFMNMTSLHGLLGKSLSKEQVNELYGKMFVQLNLNSASEEEILLIPGLGKRMLHEFQEYRPYRTIAQFRKEIGKYVDQKEVARLEQYVFVPIRLNAASDEDILTIPGLGKRMLREFKEYRPYKNIEQFRKEIGKYVDKKEVARLERYVTVD
jgi:DNA uptake protein ComE-like DNA-binding protein